MRFVFEGIAVNVLRKSIGREELPFPGSHSSRFSPDNGVGQVDSLMTEGLGWVLRVGWDTVVPYHP
jgi:hypothetical protein